MPGFFEFQHPPNYTIIWVALLAFALFSVSSFYLQTKFERSVNRVSTQRTLIELDSLLKTKRFTDESYVPSFDQDNFAKLILQNLKYNADFLTVPESELFESNAVEIRKTFNVVTDFDADIIDRLWFWRSDFNGLLPDLERICGEYITEIRRMDAVIDRAAEAHQRFSNAWGHIKIVVPDSISKDGAVNALMSDGEFDLVKFELSLSETLKYLGIYRKSLEVFHKFGSDLLIGIRNHKQLQNVQNVVFSYGIPIYLSLALIFSSVVFLSSTS